LTTSENIAKSFLTKTSLVKKLLFDYIPCHIKSKPTTHILTDFQNSYTAEKNIKLPNKIHIIQ